MCVLGKGFLDGRNGDTSYIFREPGNLLDVLFNL